MISLIAMMVLQSYALLAIRRYLVVLLIPYDRQRSVSRQDPNGV